MRIIAGRWGGRALVAPKGRATRPTSDRVREALFSILGDVAGFHVLDLFAGTGAFALEALSRGAASAVAVERARAALAVLRANARALGAEDVLDIVCTDALRFVARGRTFDLVFADPPWPDSTVVEPVLAEHAPRWVAPDGWLIVERAARMTEPSSIPGFAPPQLRRYGEAALALHRRRGSAQLERV